MIINIKYQFGFISNTNLEKEIEYSNKKQVNVDNPSSKERKFTVSQNWNFGPHLIRMLFLIKHSLI